jgi:hypothetical protein
MEQSSKVLFATSMIMILTVFIGPVLSSRQSLGASNKLLSRIIMHVSWMHA